MNALGQHLLIEYYDCAEAALDDLKAVEQTMRQAALNMGVTVIQSYFHHFEPFGISGVIVIEESHLTVHTWPEYRYAAVDFFTCTPDVQPEAAIELLRSAFQAQRIEQVLHPRGLKEQVGPIHQNLEGLRTTIRPNETVQPQHWFTDQDENTALSLRFKDGLLFQEQSPYQLVEIYDTIEYGRMLTLDHVIMCTEKDESSYHEMMVHVPMQWLSGRVQRALVIGGGDGGVVRELLRYPDLEQVSMAEIDAVVLQAVRTYMPTLSQSFHDPRLQVHIDEGLHHLAQQPEAFYDLIIIDAPDPDGPAAQLFEAAAYQRYYAHLRPGGMLVTQSESPYYRADVLQKSYRHFCRLFGQANTGCYLSFIPTYTSGMWSFLIARKGQPLDLEELSTPAIQAFTEQHQLNYYHAGIHRAAFQLPLFVQRMLQAALATPES
ncbi:MAG: polyamine aminopropyltransferase, partial [Phaeodactylibacter sp.]|nr:polyamine aminopropyltransferase [Phaeodactylibacter sp.]